MFCRPLLPLLALAALLVLPPACRALSCHSCSDVSHYSDHPFLKSSGGDPPPLCSEFDASVDKFKIESCALGLDKTCAKVSWDGGEKRGCYDSTFEEGCKEEDGLTFCTCTSDYCNSAGVTAPALLLLLLLLPAALMATLYSRQ